jgi:Uma2 family endonuclease
MELVVDQFERLHSVVLTWESGPPTDEQFFELCERYPDSRIEVSAEGDVIIMPPVHPRTGRRNARLTAQLVNWSDSIGGGGVYDSSSGFFLPNGARRSPDAAYISSSQLSTLPTGETGERAYWYAIPEFIIELKSHSDRLTALRAKMREWIDNGVALAWPLIPDTRSVEIYRPNLPVEVHSNATQIHGEGPVEGFTLNLTKIWE